MHGIKGRNVRWILDADIRAFFDTISHDWLNRFLEHRTGDPQDDPSDPEMVEGGCAGQRPACRYRGGDPSRGGPYSLNAKGNFRFEREIGGWRGGSVIDLRRKR